MTDTTTATPAAPANAEPGKPTEMSISYKGPDLKTLAIGGGLLAGVVHTLTNTGLGTLAPSLPAAITPAVASASAAATI